MTNGQITEQKFYGTNAFLWENLYIYIFAFILNGPTFSFIIFALIINLDL